jgi:hypothetical protein
MDWRQAAKQAEESGGLAINYGGDCRPQAIIENNVVRFPATGITASTKEDQSDIEVRLLVEEHRLNIEAWQVKTGWPFRKGDRFRNQMTERKEQGDN